MTFILPKNVTVKNAELRYNILMKVSFFVCVYRIKKFLLNNVKQVQYKSISGTMT